MKNGHRVLTCFLLLCFMAGFVFTDESPTFSWQKPQTTVLPTGAHEWKPEPFVFEKGESVRYIDYENGDDNADGSSKETPWKHHPWDKNASGKAVQCTGIHTYVFKRGATYRGTMIVRDAGEPGNPIRLTSDPAWGEGKAVISGAEIITGWKQGADHKDIPEAEKVWYADIAWPVRTLWMTEGETITRIPLARTPNWKVSNKEDVLSEWYRWSKVEKTKVNGRDMHLAIDKAHLDKSPDYFKDAIVWSEWTVVMGTPYSSIIEAYDPEKKGVAFQGRWFRQSAPPDMRNRYCLEDKPHYLDDPEGEFWFEKKGKAGRLYLRLPEGKDPNAVTIEAGRYYNLIEDKASSGAPLRMDIYRGDKNQLENRGLKHAVISGLSFRFTNTWWDIHFAPWMHKEVDNAAIRLLGSSDDVIVKNCDFRHLKCAVRVSQLTGRCKAGSHVFSDNSIAYIDGSAVKYSRGPSVRVLRNNIFMSGLRPYRQSDGHCIKVSFPETMEVAGNILDRIYGSGIFLFGGKRSGGRGDVPLARYLVYGNQATNTLLCANDWGGIETWQGGPFYVFNNVSGNPNGYWHYHYRRQRPASARLGFAYYLDGSYKNYHFNNIAWGISNNIRSPLCSNTAFYHAVTTIQTAFFNNTAYLFTQGSGWSSAGGRQLNLGNIFSDISLKVFNHGKQKEDKDAVYKKYPLETIAYAKNIFYSIPDKFAALGGSGAGVVDFESFKKVIAEKKLLSSDLGTVVEESPLQDAANHDFRPKAGSPAIDGGVKVFVPWSLYAMVGEWNFRRNNSDPAILLDDHWYMRPYYTNRAMYKDCPVNNMKAVGVTENSYVKGDLEDWTDGALSFNGKDQYAVLTDAQMSRPFPFKKGEDDLSKGRDSRANPNPGTGNFLIEIYFKTEKNIDGGVLVSKEAGTGYLLSIGADGMPKMTLLADGAETCSRLGSGNVNDGEWHHLIAEVDRTAKQGIAIYIDGKKANGTWKGAMPPKEMTLTNTGDFLLGKGNKEGFFKGTVDFLRVARGTLADAKTTIEELYEWQFNGPNLRDFAGNTVTGQRRDAGALELTDK